MDRYFAEIGDWIDTAEQLPDANQVVLVWHEAGSMKGRKLAQRREDGYWQLAEDPTWLLTDPEHIKCWYPLPPPWG